MEAPEGLIVGSGSLDDAAVLRWPVGSAQQDAPHLVQTVDFITPVVDDPYVFGAVAAANAISDIYAMGATPRYALNIVCFPSDRLPLEVLEKILAGGADKAREAGVVIVGGHTVNDAEPKYGLAVTGEVAPERLITNAGARAGDLLVLTKPLGTGLLIGALRGGALASTKREALEASMLRLNAAAAECAIGARASAVTDVSGFGLLGHAHHLLMASGLSATVDTDHLPSLPGASELASEAKITGAAGRNWSYVEDRVSGKLESPGHRLVVDPQTSGGLLIAIAPERSERLLTDLRASGDGAACVVGEVRDGEPGTIDLT